MKVKEESEKVGLKLDIQKTKIMASGPITLWQIDMEAVSVFIFWGSKITADGDGSHEIVMWDVRCGCESWTIKKAERRRIDAFELVLEKTLESPLDCKEIQPAHPKGDQSWVFIGRTDVEAEIPNTLATWCEELTHWKRPWCWGKLRARGEGGYRGWDGWMASLTFNGHEFEEIQEDSAGQRSLAWCSPQACRVGTWLSDWTTTILPLKMTFYYYYSFSH